MNLAGRIQAIKYMKSKNYEQGDLQKIEANACTSSSDLYDPNLPSGWKYRYVKLKSGHSRMFSSLWMGQNWQDRNSSLNFLKKTISPMMSLAKPILYSRRWPRKSGRRNTTGSWMKLFQKDGDTELSMQDMVEEIKCSKLRTGWQFMAGNQLLSSWRKEITMKKISRKCCHG